MDRILVGLIFTFLFAVVFTFGYFGTLAEAVAWSDVFRIYIECFGITAVLLLVEHLVAGAVLRRPSDRNPGQHRTLLKRRVIWRAMAIALTPALLMLLVGSVLFRQRTQPPSDIATYSRELIDDIHRAHLPRLQLLARDTIVFSPGDSGELDIEALIRRQELTVLSGETKTGAADTT